MYMQTPKIYFFLPWFLLAVLTGCYNQRSESPEAVDQKQMEGDSLSFYSIHHYSQGYNFVFMVDSLSLVCQQPDELPFDSVTFYEGDRIVVADIMTVSDDPVDSVWIKVARDQQTIGWIHESDLEKSTSPDDPISQFIDLFSDAHLLWFLALTVVTVGFYYMRRLLRKGIYCVHFHDIDSFYPTLLVILVAASATFYASIQLFAPETWRHFYYYPTLNPFSLPLILGIFVCSVWALLIISVAVFQDVMRQCYASEALYYFISLSLVCSVVYVVFSISTLYYLGYLLLPAYIYWAVGRYRKRTSRRVVCGNCGEEISGKGRCPYCGAINE